MAMTYDELIQAINDQALRKYQGGLAEADGGIRDSYTVDGIPYALSLNSGGVYDQTNPDASPPAFTPYYYNPNAPQNQAGYDTQGGIPGTYKTVLGRNPDGSINTDRGYFSKKSAGIDAVMDAVPMIGALAMGGAALGPAGFGLWGGAPAAGVGAAEGAVGAGGYAIPTAEELAASGFGSGGMGMSGAGGIGSVSSVSGAGAGAAGYGSALGGLGEIAGSGITGGGNVASVAAPAGGAGGGGGGGLLGQVGDFAGSKLGSSLLGAALGGLGGANSPDNLTSTSQQNIDPRMASILYGANGNNGFISDILRAGNQPQKAGSSIFGQSADNYLGKFGAADFEGMRGAANELMTGNINAPQMAGSQVNAPSQNNLNLSPAYQDMIYGQPGNNPYLTGGIQKGINQANTAFQNMQTDATRNLTENILPSIRSGAQVNGQYGGSRQALSEGRALNDFSTQIGRAASQIGQNNTDSAIAAQAGAYNTDRSNALSAMGNLSGNQYNTANTNAGLQQQAQQANMQSQMNTNSLNSANKATGINAQSGLLGQAYGYGTNNDMYGLNKIGKTSGLLGQYTGLGGSSTQSQPLYQNQMGNILGGATAGLGLYNAYNNLNKKPSNGTGGLFDAFRFNREQ